MQREPRLKSEARSAAKWRGHRLGQFRRINKGVFDATCQECRQRVTVNLNPAPNEIDIGGEAVALNCSPWFKHEEGRVSR